MKGVFIMGLKDILGKVLGGKTLEDAGINAVIGKLQGLTAEGGDKKILDDIIAALKKLLGNKDQLNAILKQVKSIAGGIGDKGLKDTVLGILKLLKK